MNITYIIVFVALLISFAVQCKYFRHDSNGFFFTIFMVKAIAVVVLLFCGLIVPTGNDSFVIKPAISTKVGTEVVVQAEGWATMTSDSMKFVDKDLVMVRRQQHSAFGVPLNIIYEIHIKDDKK